MFNTDNPNLEGLEAQPLSVASRVFGREFQSVNYEGRMTSHNSSFLPGSVVD